MKVPKNDAVITFMADEAHRYRTNPAMVSVMNGLYGDRSWQSIPDGLSTAQSKAALVKLYCDKLEALGCHTGVPQKKWTRLACFQFDSQGVLVGDW
ncbi:MAG: hypothetical protein BWY79_01734 [Actinobacteria bacterium ADurb.Bin444]|nr:MAG: hypothetical protein BWY79_01734 [Actinobacteria bacterium ADurb.Bin444]